MTSWPKPISHFSPYFASSVNLTVLISLSFDPYDVS